MLLDGLLLVDVRGGVHDFLEGIDETVAAFVAHFFSNGGNGQITVVFHVIHLFAGKLYATLVKDGTEVIIVFLVDDFGDVGDIGTCELYERVKIERVVTEILGVIEDGIYALCDETIGVVSSKREKRRN